MKKRMCFILAALLVSVIAVPSFAEEADTDMAAVMLGDWWNDENEELYLLFDGVDKFYYNTDEAFYYGIYTYLGDSEFQLIDDLGEEHILYLNDDLSVSLDGVDGFFNCGYNYPLMDYPNTDEGTWLNEDGVTTLLFDLYGEFELENDDVYYFGDYIYEGGGDYRLTDVDGVEFLASAYEDGSIGVEGMDGYFWLQDEITGDAPFEYVEEDEEYFEELTGSGAAATVYDDDPIELSGTWYKYGDETAIPFILDGDTYSCEGSVFGEETTGTWMLEENILYLTDEQTEPAAYISMESDDGMPSGWEPYLMAGNRLLYASAKDTWFLHESVINTEDGELLGQMADFMNTDWWYQEEGTTLYLEFSNMGNAVICTTFYEDGETYQEIVGNWSLQDGSIVAEYIDDSAESYTLPAESITAAGVEFTK